jgi:hypothetical protein
MKEGFDCLKLFLTTLEEHFLHTEGSSKACRAVDTDTTHYRLLYPHKMKVNVKLSLDQLCKKVNLPQQVLLSIKIKLKRMNSCMNVP